MSTRLSKEDYNEIKSNVTMRQVAELYGFTVNRKGLCTCPFHNDKSPSLKIYENGKGFYCFVCGAGGDIVTFVSRHYNLTNEEAAYQLIEDFSLYDPREEKNYRKIRERELKIKKRKELDYFKKCAYAALKVYWMLLCESIQDPEDKHFNEACSELSIVEYRLKCLEEHLEEYYADKKAVRKIEQYRNRILSW